MAKNRKWSAFCIMVVCSLMLTSCSSQNKVKHNQSADSSVNQSSSQGKESVTLTVWGSEDDQELLQSMVDSFIQEYAQEATIQITVAPQNEATCRNAVLGDVTNAADVFTFADDQLMALAAAGAIEPIKASEIVKAENVESSVVAATISGNVYAYPLTADNGYFMYYNKKYFSNEDVKSFNTMLDVAAQNGKQVTMDIKSGWYLYSFFGQTGLTMGLNDDGVTNYCNWNATDTDIKGVDIAKAILNIAQNPGFLGGDDTALIQGAASGKVIAGISGVWSGNALEEIWGEDYAAVKLPTYDCAGKKVQMASFAGYKMIGVNAYSTQKEWAEKFAEWITNEQNQTLRFMERGQGPSNTAAAASEAVSKSPAIQAVIAQSEYSVLQRVGVNYWDPVSEFGSTMCDGNPEKTDLQEMLNQMVKQITALIQ